MTVDAQTPTAPVAGPPLDSDIPVLDVGDFLAGVPGARARLAAELRPALEKIGFFFIVNHGVPRAQIDAVFAEAARFHALPLDRKIAIHINGDQVGYMPDEQQLVRTYVDYDGHQAPDKGEAFFMQRDRAPIALPVDNQWPTDLPGFRETLVGYFETMEELAFALLPAFATALELKPDHFAPYFEKYRDVSYLRLARYPPEALAADQYNISPHTDSTFLTLLATTEVPGLELMPEDGDWFLAPPWSGAFLVNSGDILTRWSNGRVLSTRHRVRNLSGVNRYGIPFFYHPAPDAVIECLPTCHDADNPPREPPITCQAYLQWFLEENFAHYGKFEIATADGTS